VTTPGLPRHLQTAVLTLLGVEAPRVRQARHYERTHGKTTWIADKDLTDRQRDRLRDGVDLVRRAIGPHAIARVRVYSDSEENPCARGFYRPSTGEVAIDVEVLTDRHDTLLVLLHEAAHRVGHLGGGGRIPSREYGDRSRGFEHTLSDFAAQLLGRLADAGALPDPVAVPARWRCSWQTNSLRCWPRAGSPAPRT
jgi:hypothetical protein